MGLHYILGSAGAGKTYTLYNYIIEEAIKNPDETYMVIVPEQFTLQTQKDLVNMHPRQGIMNIDVLSFLRLAFRVFEETGGDDRLILEDTGKSMIVKKVVLNKRHELSLFGTSVKKRGFIEEIKSVISEFYQYSIGDSEFEQMLSVTKSKPLLYTKLKDIKIIYDAFQEFLQERYITNEEIFEVLGEVLNQSELVKKSVVCLDGYTGFTPSQYKLMRKIICHAKEVYITVTIDKIAFNKKQLEHELFYLSYSTIEKLNKIAANEKKDIDVIFVKDSEEPYRYRESKALAYLEKNLFRNRYKVFEEEQEDITVYAAADREEECERTAVLIRQLVKKEGYRYRDIAVVSADVSGYGSLLRRKLSKLSVPCFVDEKESILTNQLSELIRALLSVIRYDYTYDSIIHLLKTGLLNWEQDEIDILENYIIALGIRGRYRYHNEWKRAYRTAYEISVEEINQYRIKFIEMMKPLEEVFLNKDSTVKDYLTALYYFFREQKIEEKLSIFAEEKKAEENIESKLLAIEYEQVYRLVLEMFDRIAGLLGQDILPLDEFCEIIETGLSEARVGLIPPGTDQVVIGDIERTRLKDIKVLFFLGVNDGLVTKTSSGGILSDIDRQFFSENNIELAPTLRQNAYMTDFFLYLNLTKPQNKLYLSYYKLDGEGKTAHPYSLIARIFGMFKKMKLMVNNESVLGTDMGFTFIANALREYGDKPFPDYFYELFCLYNENIKSSIEIQKLLDAAFYKREESGISKKAAIRLYGNTLLGSVTRMEQYASCAFSHFLAYGLSLEEREEYVISMPDIGNIYHMALEYFSENMKTEGYTWHSLSEEGRIRIGNESVIKACADYNNGILESSKRNSYLIHKAARVLHRTTKTMKEQLSSGMFEPYAYEKSFLYSDEYLNLRGRIDRVDLHEKEDKVYVQIVDYKSGSKQFDLESLYYGLQLQLGVYLEAGLDLIKNEIKDKEAVPAGVFYYNIDDPIVDKTKDAEEEIKKRLVMNGLVNSDKEILSLLDMKFADESGELKPLVKSLVIPAETNKDGQLTKRSSAANHRQFEELLKYINEKIHKICSEIVAGNTKVNPYKSKDGTACDYCGYSSVCGFDVKLSGNAYNKLEKMTEDEVWNKIGGKDALDKGTGRGNQNKEL